ncbi:hypothetical protein GRX03_06770 [Halovenus sp. WSH3]|uniref:Uncharacterized protein n=1 Tax=Halovenus carboxidivorans TaxID=2692199 RepID=A0A6B0T2F3_9EURY|nr:hypothetical protein [Halovenus carboxidivorans]MXR51307.1 hypothetical protein [Halovenus carboxidivorans]
MEAWRFLVSMSILMVVYAVIVTLLGQPPGPVELVVATVFAGIGLYVSEQITKRVVEPGE